MALQSSGAISLNEIHIEAGGSSGTTASINDSDIRDLIDKSSGATMSFNEWYGASAFTARWVGAGGGKRRSMQYVDIATLSNASDFGDMHFHNNGESRQLCGSCASITRGVYIGGNSNEAKETLEYITIASTGNGTDFGDCGNNYGSAGASNDTRGVYMSNAYDMSEIEYITIASTGDTQDFGNLAQSRLYPGSCASSTRACVGGGFHGSNFGNLAQIDYITTASLGNASDFGDLTIGRKYVNNGSMGSNTRGIFAGGHLGSEQPGVNGPNVVIDYITIASTGNATDFGDCIEARFAAASGSSKTRALPRCGGYQSVAGATLSTTMDYITIASTGDASDFGDLIDGEQQWSGASNGCGGTSSTS